MTLRDQFNHSADFYIALLARIPRSEFHGIPCSEFDGIPRSNFDNLPLF